MRRATVPSPSELFDAAVHSGRGDALAELDLEVAARPGDPAPLDDTGLVAIRRGLGENRLAIVSPVVRVVEGRGRLEAEGVECEGSADGVFAEVQDRRTRRRALRIAGIDGLIVRDTLLMRSRRSPLPPPAPAPDTAAPTPSDRDLVPFVFDALDLPPVLEPVTTVPGTEDTAEAISDPVVAPRAPLAISAPVGRGARNAASDVKAVQDRLVALRVLESGDATTERPASAGPVADTALAQTIEAIERFQRQLGIPVDGIVDVRSTTRTELDLVVAPPTAAELAAVTDARRSIGESINRGLTIKGSVGATPAGNAPDDVRAVQRRLVEIGKLAATHGETPLASTVTTDNLRATIAALRALQADVDFWRSKGTIAGATTPGVVAPGDATAALLDRVSVYTMTLGTHRVSFRDHVVSGNTRSDAGVVFVGTASPSAIPLADYKGLGLSASQAAALKQVSSHEGSFDAINTYDRALVSVGFIQFAGGRGLPRYLALLKARQPAKFRDLVQRFGIDVEFTVSRGTIEASRIVVLVPDGNRVLRTTSAEAAIRDDKRLTTALIVSGRDRDVQLTQIEAAVRDYVLPILNAIVTWGSAPRRRAPLKDLIRSQKGMAALFDRCIQEGLAAARRRFERVIQRLVLATPPEAAKKPAPTPSAAELQRREGDILAELERDLQAAADVAERLARARALLSRLSAAASAAGAALPALLSRPEIVEARKAISEARASVPGIANVTTPHGVTIEATIEALTATLTAEEGRLAMTTPPVSLEAARGLFIASRQALATALGPVSASPTFLARIQRIRRSTLDSGLGPAEIALPA